ncbi:MAG: tetratricopeptide repeat protein [Polyangiaceae bacterium]|nr:tetratricopeptide repeat protein [Polyangiaceae bacterium]
MTRRTVPSIRPSDLRDHADSARIDRVWDRLEHDLSARAPDKPRSATTMLALAAAAMGVFTGGVCVGWILHPERSEAPIHATSIESSTPNVLAAGRQSASYDLPGGGTITLSPGATVEVDRDGHETLTLRLLRGEASTFTTSAGRSSEIELIVEDARVLAKPGSEVFVRRNTTDIDVRVASGSAQLYWPSGSRELSTGERIESVPMRMLLAPVSRVERDNDDDDLRRPPRATLPPPRDITSLPHRIETPMATIAPPDWRTKYNAGELAQALEMLRGQPGGIDGAIMTARSAAELAAISDIARAKGGDPAAALNALTQLVERFPSDPYAEIAAYTLGGMYEKLGQPDQAQKYFERARSLKGVLAEDALCKQIRAEHRAGRKDEAKRMAQEYVNKYPDGRCKEDVERALSGEELPREEPEAVLDAGVDDAASTPPAAASSPAPAAP